MSMEKINGSPLAHRGMLENQRLRSSSTAKKTESAAIHSGQEGQLAPASGDTVEISDTAYRLITLRQSVEAGRAVMASLPDVRADKLATVRSRLATGFYESAEVRGKVADGVGQVLRSMEKL